MEECCPNKPREHVQGRWRSVVPPGPENNRCWEVRGVLSHQALTADAGRVELFFFSNRPREQVLGGRRSVVPQALRAGAGRVECCPTGPESRCWEGGGVLSHRP